MDDECPAFVDEPEFAVLFYLGVSFLKTDRRLKSGIDFGLWPDIPSSALYIPLDIHTGKVARDLGLLHRKQDDWKAVTELTGNLRQFDASDPVKYDYALFGMGIYEKNE